VKDKRIVTVSKAAREAAVKRAILGDKGSMKLTANQRRSLDMLKKGTKTFVVVPLTDRVTPVSSDVGKALGIRSWE
jgi:hypothetical protein